MPEHIIGVEDAMSIKGQWHRTFVYTDGRQETFDLTHNGLPRMADKEQMAAYFGTAIVGYPWRHAPTKRLRRIVLMGWFKILDRLFPNRVPF